MLYETENGSITQRKNVIQTINTRLPPKCPPKTILITQITNKREKFIGDEFQELAWTTKVLA